MAATYPTGLSKAEEIIALRDREYARQSNFRSLWQSTSDLIFPQTFGIERTITPGTELMNHLFDVTAVEEAENTASGLVTNLFPPGQRFYEVSAPHELERDEEVRQYLPYMTEQTHESMFNSNFIQQVSNTIHYWFVFGIGSLYSDWDTKYGLNYRDYGIGRYLCIENAHGIIDTNIITMPKSAREIVELFGSDEKVLGHSIYQAWEKPERREEKFNVVQLVGPREDHDDNPILRPANAMPFQSVFVAEKDRHVLKEGGYEEFPFAIPRYNVIYGDVYGRGRGTSMLPQVRTLNRLAKDYMEMSNKWVNPPKQVLDSFDGVVDVTPGALNYVSEVPAVLPIDMGANGAYPVTKDILEYYRESVRQGMYKNAFEPITPLQGDRRNTTEIIERLKEGLKKMAKPMSRLFVELLPPVIMRSTKLLIRNGVIAPPPDVLAGVPLKIEFINPLALALRDQQSKGGQYWVNALGAASEIFPSVLDNVDSDKWARDLGESLGVKADQIRPMREVRELRQEREEQRQDMLQMQVAGAAADSYGKLTKAPEPGSPVGEEV